jgi:hypothetical protein
MNYIKDKASQIEKTFHQNNVISKSLKFILIHSNLTSRMDPTDETCKVNK